MNRFIYFDYNDTDLPFMDEYKNQLNLSLDEAFKPVFTHVNDLAVYLKKAKKFRHFPSEHNLTEDESTAIYLYTDDSNEHVLHHILNRALQTKDPAKVAPWFGFLKILHAALHKLPTVKDTLWRGLPIDIARKLEENEEVVLCSISSCSLSSTTIKHYLDQNAVLCSIESLKGKDVRGYTSRPDDQEVLLRFGTHLRIERKQSNNKRLDISFKELKTTSAEKRIYTDVLLSSANNGDTRTNDNRPAKSTKTTSNSSRLKNEVPTENLFNAVITFSNGDRYKLAYLNGKKEGYGTYHSVNREKFTDQEADDIANGEGICKVNDGTRFIGTFRHGSRHGHGILINSDGSTTACQWSNDEIDGQRYRINSPQGYYEWKDTNGENRWYGVYNDHNGNKYIGNVVDGKAHGLGIRIWNDSSRYEGNFKDDKKHGYGIYYYTNRDKYLGEWRNDVINGVGTLTWHSGTCYKGKFRKGKRHGDGKLTFANGQKQEGKWEHDKYIS